MLNVLLVDSDTENCSSLAVLLRSVGFQTDTASDGAQALGQCLVNPPDLVLLEADLPRIDGFEVCQRIRTMSAVPIVFLTSLTGESAMVHALELGADDFLTKPVSARGLLARLQAVLRRYRPELAGGTAGVIRVGTIALDISDNTVTKNGRPVPLTPVEVRLLHLLALQVGRIVPHARLVESVWGYSGEDGSGLLRTHIAHLRGKLGLPVTGPGAIEGVRSRGYRLIRPATDYMDSVTRQPLYSLAMRDGAQERQTRPAIEARLAPPA